MRDFPVPSNPNFAGNISGLSNNCMAAFAIANSRELNVVAG
jgi:hypothetical protein